jgi:hypothetical protein
MLPAIMLSLESLERSVVDNAARIIGYYFISLVDGAILFESREPSFGTLLLHALLLVAAASTFSSKEAIGFLPSKVSYVQTSNLIYIKI